MSFNASCNAQGSLAGTTLMMCNGVIVMGSAIVMQTNSVMSGGHAEVGGYVVAAIDDFVLGVGTCPAANVI